jgi:16S rRNA (cytosine967-C5)-methyltransferase
VSDRPDQRPHRGADRSRGPRQRSRTAPSQRSRRAEPARFAAYTLLRAVADGAYANLELPRILQRSRLTGREAAFATELAFGAIRWQGFYDAVLSAVAQRPIDAIDAKVLDVLRLGAHQLLGMRVPSHAAADQTVGLARSVAGAGAAGFVNAVMRRISERDRDAWLAAVVPGGGGSAAQAIEHSHPEWIVKALRAALLAPGRGSTTSVDDELVALLEADNTAPRVSIAARPSLAEVSELLATAEGLQPSRISPIGAVLGSGQPGALAAVRDGRAAVQDEGSQLVALALAAAEVPADAPARWLDLCAGPGGKAGVLGGAALGAGADFTAVEVTPHRADLVRSSLRRLTERAAELGRTIEVRTADGRTVGADEPGRYARVLVDVPCTGLGALRRRPEARWRRTPQDLAELGPLQRALLESALDATAPGGVVGYATCSPHLAETGFVVKDVLRRRTDAELEDARPLFAAASRGALADLGEGPTVQLWPHLHGTDAMFFALIRRR